MTTEYFQVLHTDGKTVYFRFFDPSNDKVFDFDDGVWEANLAACTDPKLSATEKTDLGDADQSLYTAGLDLADLYIGATPKEFTVQAVDDLGTDEIISTKALVISVGEKVDLGVATLTAVTAIKASTDGLAFTVAGKVDSNAQYVEGVQLSGKTGDNLNTFFHNAGADTSKVVDNVGTSSVGGGATAQTVQLQDSSGQNIADADAWLTSDAAGTVVVDGTYQTNSNGIVTFMVDLGATYYIWTQKDGYQAIQGQAWTPT